MIRLGSWYIRAIAPSWNNPQKDFNVATHHLESMLNWSLLQGISLRDWTDEQFIEYLRFRLHPPANWIGAKACPRFVENSLLPFSEWGPNQRWRPYQLKLDSIKGVTQASVLHMIRRNYNWAAGFFHFCNAHLWTCAPKGKSFTVVDWVKTPSAITKISIDEVTETPQAPGCLAYFVKNGLGRWEWRRPGSSSPSVELSPKFGHYFEDYLLYLGIDASEPLPQHPLFPQRRRRSAGLSAFSLAKHLAGFRTFLGDVANQSPDPLISRSESKFRRINLTMIRRNSTL
ncbi:hypothetical protein [Pseudomonas cichorii]|uniref:hypothetical protein n=1 Tax=Pseudomonas cichorii TaxID=36746 RepID=UPI0011C48E9B|nr:hypothetical protein [Pseudomonas cichorii]